MKDSREDLYPITRNVKGDRIAETDDEKKISTENEMTQFVAIVG